MRLHRAMVVRMTTAPRRELIKELVAKKREGMTGAGVGEVSTPGHCATEIYQGGSGTVDKWHKVKSGAPVANARCSAGHESYIAPGYNWPLETRKTTKVF